MPANELPSLFRTTWRSLIESASLAALYYVTALGGMYIYNHYDTSPAVIWLPVGIAAAAVIRRGYRVGVPVFIAQFCAVLTISGSIPTALVSAAGYAIEFVVLAYVIDRYKFDLSFERTRSVMTFVMLAATVTAIAPLIATIAFGAMHALTVAPLLNFTRAWIAGVFSMLIVTPVFLTWYPYPFVSYSRKQIFEIVAALAALVAINVYLFWTPLPKYAGISVIFFIPTVLIWYALRFHPRWLTLGIALTSVIGIAGSIVTMGTSMLSQQLFSDEVYIGMVAAIFYVFAAVVEERRRAYRDLEAAYRTTMASDQAKNEFIAILAHELRNPLAPIVSSLELLALETESAECLTIIRETQQNTVMIRRLLDDLLDTVRLSQGKFALRKEAVRLGDIIDGSVASIVDAAQGKNLRVRVKSRCHDLIISADPVRVRQIVINLLNNACKYTPLGGSIEVVCEQRGDNVLISVRDTGIGITPEMAERIFEPFKQLDEQSHYTAGLGIGLYLTKQFVEMHGGTIRVESAGHGKGSAFSVRLPIGKTGSSDDAAPSPVRAPDARRVLVVDDNEAAARGLQRLLSRYGHNVRSLNRGEAVFAAVADYQPDVILLDIGLPDLSGHEVARRLRAAGTSVRIVAITGYGQQSDRLAALEAGCDEHLTKPAGTTELLAALEGRDMPVMA